MNQDQRPMIEDPRAAFERFLLRQGALHVYCHVHGAPLALLNFGDEVAFKQKISSGTTWPYYCQIAKNLSEDERLRCAYATMDASAAVLAENLACANLVRYANTGKPKRLVPNMIAWHRNALSDLIMARHRRNGGG